MSDAEKINRYLVQLLHAGINVPSEVLAASERQMEKERKDTR